MAPDPDAPGGHALLVAFDTDNREFVRGFEAGRIWALLEANDAHLECVVHTANAEMMMRMADATDRSARGEEVDDTWTVVTFAPPGDAEPTPGLDIP